MNLNPATMLDPVFHFLDWIIVEWGEFICFSGSSGKFESGMRDL
jgi:hypothetical protein